MPAVEPAQSLHTGRAMFVTLIVSLSPRRSEVASGCGFDDFVFVDTGRIALGLQPLLRSSVGITKLVSDNPTILI